MINPSQLNIHRRSAFQATTPTLIPYPDLDFVPRTLRVTENVDVAAQDGHDDH